MNRNRWQHILVISTHPSVAPQSENRALVRYIVPMVAQITNTVRHRMNTEMVEQTSNSPISASKVANCQRCSGNPISARLLVAYDNTLRHRTQCRSGSEWTGAWLPKTQPPMAMSRWQTISLHTRHHTTDPTDPTEPTIR